MKDKSNSASRKASVFDIAVSLVFCVLILAGCVFTFILPDKDFSENENTSLTTLSDVFSGNVVEDLFSGELFDKAADYFRHQFPLRNKMLELKALTDMALVRYETNGVIYGADGYLIPREDNAGTAFVGGNVAAIDALLGAFEKDGTEALFALVPRPCDVLERYYPSAYSAEPLEKVRGMILDNVKALDLKPALKNAADKGEYVYYKTDHHWTSYGAYLAYCEIMRGFGVSPIPLDSFEREVVSTEFYGTSWSSVMSPSAQPDTVEFFHLKNGGEYVTEIANSPVRFDGFYNRAYLDAKDKYLAFMGGNYGLVTVKAKDAGSREKMLIVKDSYANSAVQFLALHYDLVIVDPRYYKQSVYELAKTESVDRVLILCGADGITDANTYLVLNFGLPKE
ncbi:MAG: hypothetical protein IJF74_03715 [Clostridia bacterium]|nr:hypothetical protein [Clostridia bacterium]